MRANIAILAVLALIACSEGPAKAGHYVQPDGPAEAGHYGQQDGPTETGRYVQPDGPAEAGHYVPREDVVSGFSRTRAGEASSQAATPAPAFDSNRAWEHLRRQVAFGPRPAGSAALAETRRYILDQLKSAGVAAREQAFEASTPLGRISMVNVVATIPGTSKDRLAIASHFDTKFFREFRFVGANDGGSSTAVLLELARVLKARKNPLTIELLFFDGEEATRTQWEGNDNTYGSRHYVDAAKADGSIKDLRGLILLDMIGGKNLRIPRESGSTKWMVDAIFAAAAKLGHTKQFVNDNVPVGGDDHYPFLAAGVPAVDIIHELSHYEEWHTPRDDLSAVSARSLQIVGDVVLEALPAIEKRLAR